MDAELDSPDQLIPQESQPSGQSYIKYSRLGQVPQIKKTIASFLSHSLSFFDYFKVINEYAIYVWLEA
ncbi:hypothetical protein [Staphylococcus delphini]|uniref:hypothetical protein n=1 Tax=Staphylococcus delphini TaxID=53344 RepID=UPI000BBB75C8|nr:hypothetical protein [Staphylococcus delphini]PCF37452.1 hypothetical protein B5B99_09225 [Staphylococcus delphini]PCF53582.1 hypothetical protein B5C03_03925 [Staphylococcus delphini]PCF58826.1 hypothetical protein B5B97_00030 [Staphylococcus delphini]PCF60073.1 hypothetical protein B5C05_05035 [Staphylococcus delphini]